MIDWYSDDLVEFEPIEHKYTNVRSRERYIGVTSFIGLFEPEFNGAFWSWYKAIEWYFNDFKKAKYKFTMFKMNLPREDTRYIEDWALKHKDSYTIRVKRNSLLAEWKVENEKSIIKGHDYHQYQEDRINFNKYRITNDGYRPLAITDGIPRVNGKLNLHRHLPDGAYAELLLKNHFLRMSGQCDYSFIETIGDTRWVDIDDYKTNKKLTFDNPYTNFLEPINFLEHSKFNIYRLQLLLYGWMFEQYGFKVRKLTITYQPTLLVKPQIFNVYPFQTEINPINLLLDARKKQLKLL